MAVEQEASRFFNVWSLNECRSVAAKRQPAQHQQQALAKLHKWYGARTDADHGGILVLPTGGGKTFTAVHFLCNGPLSDGYKVLWLAHTHHLLEQAFASFSAEVLGQIREPRESLRIRVVSGTPGHFPPRDIKPSDDVVVATLQTATNAHRANLQAFRQFVASAEGRLFVVFDEAHHSPAPSYRKLLLDLREEGAPALGLTATPTYSSESRRGWLKKLFPQGILAQSRPSELIAAGVLAKPHFVKMSTSVAPSFDEREYQKWLGSYRDIPETVIDELAKNGQRNAFIADTYERGRAKYGKTLIFADRWYQCEAIVEALGKRGVKAEAVYSHVDGRATTVDARKRRSRDENAKAIERFRTGHTDVLVNIRMLTEGTDLPDAQTVFLTRQTTSTILLTQMVGRALRGPKFGGTTDAYIVSFLDDWQHAMRWAEYEELPDGDTDESVRPTAARPPLHLISIELVKRLARQIGSGVNVTPAPFVSLMPCGWYRVTYDVLVEGTEEIESNDRLVMVLEDEHVGFAAIVQALAESCPTSLEAPDAKLEQHRDLLESLRTKHLAHAKRLPDELLLDVFHVARHVGQGHGAPPFFCFEARLDHDVDALARAFIQRDLGPRAIHEALSTEYERRDRFWRTLFPRFEQLRSFYESCQARLLGAERGDSPLPQPTRPEVPSFAEPDERVKEQVKRRDGGRCLACGATKLLHVDHVVPIYHGGSYDSDNLQTLCRTCNLRKGQRTMRFVTQRTPLKSAPGALEYFEGPVDAGDRSHWERFLRRTLNFTFQSAAVSNVHIGGKGEGYYNWRVELAHGNSPSWLESLLTELFARIQELREGAGKAPLESLTVSAPGEREVRVPKSRRR